MSAIIYISDLHSPYYTHENQEDICKTVCKMNNIDNFKVVLETSIDKTALKEIFEGNNFSYLVIFSFACIGSSVSEIENIIDFSKTKNIDILSALEPIGLEKNRPSEKFIVNKTIGLSLFHNEVWKDMVDFTNENN